MACRLTLQLLPPAATRSSSTARFVRRQRRPFFASSTDHTRLLAEAEVHRLPSSSAAKDDHHQQYVLAASGMDAAMVQKVPQLHLARLLVFSCSTSSSSSSKQTTVLHDAKVINKTLGQPIDVLGKLVDAALEDAASSTSIEARGRLHGLSDWVVEGMRIQQQVDGHDNNKHASLPILSNISTESDTYQAVEAIANSSQNGIVEPIALYRLGQDAWEQLALAFVAQGLSPDAALYESKGATMTAIEHQADVSSYAGTCGAALAKLTF